MKKECSLADGKRVFLSILVLGITALFVVYRSWGAVVIQQPKIHSSFFTKRIRNLGTSSEVVQDETVSDYEEKMTRTERQDEDELLDSFGPVGFDINGSDVMVFLHMQKTGGSEFGRQLVLNINLEKDCDIIEGRKRKNCFRPNSDVETWIFSRYSTGWKCGLHSDWTELHECVSDKLNEIENVYKERRFFYVTILRDPVKRFISEWKHVQRGATWKNSLYSCNSSSTSIPKCYSGSRWTKPSLQEFMSCPYNMAINRQTRMLADLRLVHCYQRWLDKNLTVSDVEKLENAMLRSAMKNLKEMTFFGLLEAQRELQILFEHTFPFKFKRDFVQYNVTRTSNLSFTEEEFRAMTKLNRLDVELYDFAKKLFNQRYQRLKT